MKKIMIAALGLSLLSGTAVFAQNTSTGSTDTAGTMKSTHKKKSKKSKGSDTTMTGSTSTSTSK